MKKAGELHYTGRQLTAIEINSTFIRNQTEAVLVDEAGCLVPNAETADFAYARLRQTEAGIEAG